MMIALIAALGAASAVPPETSLQPWSYLVGNCWTGEAPQNGGLDTHCFESVYGGSHIRDRHSVVSDGREVYAGETLYSARGPKVIFTYWNSLGGVGTGEALFSGSEWRFTGTIHATPSSTEQPLSANWRKVAGGYEVREGAEGKARLFKRD